MNMHSLIQKALTEQPLPSLKPRDAYRLIMEQSNTILIDVRTKAELDWVGRVDVPANQFMHLEWLTYPGSVTNPDFLKPFLNLERATPIVLLCRSGVRSRMATQLLLDNGFKFAIDIMDGFEGQRDRNTHRKTISGWCADGLPWIGA